MAACVTAAVQNGAVTIEIPTDRALRGAAALRSLVEAVVRADAHDEADWIEWKGPLDLATKEGCFHVARAVLGLANREPERAQLVAEGLGFVVVGAEPNSLQGLRTVDPAQLGQVIEQYLGGADGPAWTPTYIPVDETTVLVVTVEAPEQGDPIRILRRQLDKYREGAVFVRKHGRTELAGAADMDALQRRLLASGGRQQATLAVSVGGDVPLSWFDPSTVQKEIEAWADAERDQLVEAAREVEKARRQREAAASASILGGAALSPALFEQISRAAAAFSPIPEQRTLDEYEKQVAEWRKELLEAALKGFLGRYARAGHGLIRLQAENLGSRFLPDVEIVATFGDEVAQSTDEEPEWMDYPARPHPFGEPRQRYAFASPLGAASYVPPVVPALSSVRRRTTRVDNGSGKVRWHVGDLRQQGRDESEEVYVFLGGRPTEQTLHGTWRATVPDMEGVVTGAFAIPVAEAPVNIGALLGAQKRSW